jgi:hypothetical protein
MPAVAHAFGLDRFDGTVAASRNARELEYADEAHDQRN